MDINCHILRFRKADTCPRPTDVEQWRQDLKQGLLMLKATLSPPYQLPGSILWGGLCVRIACSGLTPTGLQAIPSQNSLLTPDQGRVCGSRKNHYNIVKQLVSN